MRNPDNNFSPTVLINLAHRVGNRCSNPDCTRPTSGPAELPSGIINIGVGAHITAAAEKGPRYDATLSADQRSSFENGIWLCQVCSSLIDRDTTKYTPEVLRNWKTGAEQRAKSLIEIPDLPPHRNEPTLHLPETNQEDAYLAFSARSTKFLGREKENFEIDSFLKSKEKFSWWVIMGPAGTGKSRLALEICRQKLPTWYAGFLSKTDEFKDWLHYRSSRPTLIVIDYVASRAQETGNILLQLARSLAHLPFPVRVLLLERDKGAWWSDVIRDCSHSESAEICAYLFNDKPLLLKGLTLNQLTALAQDVCQSASTPWTQSIERSFKRRMHLLDALGRPLFAMMAAQYLGLDAAGSEANASLWDKILNKELGRRRGRVPDSTTLMALENLILLATLVGGLLPHEGGFDYLGKTVLKDLLPEMKFLDFALYCDLVSAPSKMSSLEGLQPDILGERFVLNKIANLHPLDGNFHHLLLAAWTFQAAGLCDFIVRASSDFPDDPSLAKLCILPTDSPERRVLWGRLVAELVRVINRSDSYFTQSLISCLRRLSDSHENEVDLKAECARAELQLGNIFMFVDKNSESALTQFRLTMIRAGSGSDMEAAAINNRGILYSQIRDVEKAFKDWTDVIESRGASDEARACSLNNRADIFVEKGDHEKSIADRSSVLALKETSGDRKYIALIRRSRSYFATKRCEKALEDLDTLLAISEIAPTQKAEALIERGKIYTSLGRHEGAQQDFCEVVATDQLFPGTLEKALVGLAELARLNGDGDRADSFLGDALESSETEKETFIDGLIIGARLLVDSGDNEKAQEVWTIIANDPQASNDQKEIAKSQALLCKSSVVD